MKHFVAYMNRAGILKQVPEYNIRSTFLPLTAQKNQACTRSELGNSSALLGYDRARVNVKAPF
jgi:hypothetical protein